MDHQKHTENCSRLKSEDQTKLKKDFVVIDDDLSFCLTLMYAARRSGFTIDYYTSLMDMGSIGNFERYDVAIVDYNLEQMSGIEVAEYFPVFFSKIPVLLISACQQDSLGDHSPWPKSIKNFVNKKLGAQHIIGAADSLRTTLKEGGCSASKAPDTKAQRSVDSTFLTASTQDLLSNLHTSFAAFDFANMETIAGALYEKASRRGAHRLKELAGRLKVHARHKNISVIYGLVKEIESMWSDLHKEQASRAELQPA